MKTHPPVAPPPSTAPPLPRNIVSKDLQVAVDLAPVPIFVHAAGVVLHANEATDRLMRATPGNPFTGRQVMEFVTDRSRELVASRYASLHDGPRQMEPVEYEIVRLDGMRIDVEMVSRSFLAEGRLLVITVIKDITVRKEAQRENERLIAELTRLLERVGTLEGILPICSGCKKIRDEKGHWSQVEEYVGKRTSARFSHGLCPECLKRLYPEQSRS